MFRIGIVVLWLGLLWVGPAGAAPEVERRVGYSGPTGSATDFDRSYDLYRAADSKGAQLALLLALDPRWLAEVDKRASVFAGVLSL